jgi:hypothetical protein
LIGEPILSLFKIGSPKVRGANIDKYLYSKLAPLKLGEPILNKIFIKIGSPKVRGANIDNYLYSKLAPPKLGEPIQN